MGHGEGSNIPGRRNAATSTTSIVREIGNFNRGNNAMMVGRQQLWWVAKCGVMAGSANVVLGYAV